MPPRPPKPATSPSQPRARGRAVANAEAAKEGASRPGLSRDAVAEIFRRFAARNSHPKGELDHTNPYTLLVAVVLSAQSTDAGVNRATKPLFAKIDTPQKMLDFGEERLREAIRTIGFFRTKAKNVIALSAALVRDHGGEVPANREALEKLPGVGRKSAHVVLNTAFGQPVMAVDTHIFRVANRTGLAPGKDPLSVELALTATIPERFMLHAHHWLILHGRYICKALKPDCPICPIADICLYEKKTPPAPEAR